MLNIQTEHLENHTVRLTVELDDERLDRAMRRAARTIAKKGRIPGFRPGKAPMNVVINLYGREYVLNEALDDLGNDVYREALEQSEVDPYAPGSLENVEEDGHKLIFVVPKRPTVELGDYREIREDYELQEVTDKMVEDAMESLREEQAELEPVERAAEMGDRVTFDHIEIVSVDENAEAEDNAEDDTDAAESDEDDAAAEAEATQDAEDVDEMDEMDEMDEVDDAESDDADDHDHDDDNVILHQHNWDRVLRDDDRDLFPGFSAEIVGMTAGDEKTFTLEIAEDFEAEEVRGKTVRVEARLAQVRSRSLPEWNDELASKISNGEQETIDELRVYVRQQLKESAERVADQQVFDAALEKLVADATFSYPEELVQDYMQDLLDEFDRSLRQQGLTLQDFMKITGMTEEALREQYRPGAVERAERALALGELVRAEELAVDEGDIDSEVDQMSTALGGEQAAQFKQFLMSDQSRLNIANRLASNRATRRLIAIAKGENPPKGPTPEEDAADTPEAEAVAVDQPEDALPTKGELAGADDAADASTADADTAETEVTGAEGNAAQTIEEADASADKD